VVPHKLVHVPPIGPAMMSRAHVQHLCASANWNEMFANVLFSDEFFC
jgi:hypothetical protein